MGKQKGKKPQRPEKDKDNPPTEAQLRDRAAYVVFQVAYLRCRLIFIRTASRAARKAATRLAHTITPRRPHHW